ncbi:MAG: ABC transporter permease [Bdellovibrionota bacterium]
MPFPFVRFVALRFLLNKRGNRFFAIATLICIVSIAVSVAVPVTVLAILNGFDHITEAALVQTGADLTIRRTTGDIAESSSLLSQIRSQPEIVAATPYSENQALLRDRINMGVVIKGIADDQSTRTHLADKVKDPHSVEQLFNRVPVSVERSDGSVGELLLPPIIVSDNLSRYLRTTSGTTLSFIVLPQTPQARPPQPVRFMVVGTYHAGKNDNVIFASLQDTQSLFGLGGRISGIEATVTDRYRAEATGQALSQKLGPELTVTDWTQVNRPMVDAMKLIKTLYGIVLSLLVVVASGCITAPLVMTVLEKQRDIAILKTLGTTDRKIMLVFLTQGAAVGAIGVLAGLGLGFAACEGLSLWGFPINAEVFGSSTLPVEQHLTDFVIVAVCALAVTVLAGFYPATRAAKLLPSKLFRA